MLKTLLNWHASFPVNHYETVRNDFIFNQIQHNRNPFIDNPTWAAAIWLQ
jgi:endonuclease I